MKELVKEAQRILDACQNEDKLMPEVGLPPMTLGLCSHLQILAENECSYRIFRTYKEEKDMDEGRLDVDLFYRNLPEEFWEEYDGRSRPEILVVKYGENNLGHYLFAANKDEAVVIPFFEDGCCKQWTENKQVTPTACTGVGVLEREQYIGPQRRAYLEWLVEKYGK